MMAAVSLLIVQIIDLGLHKQPVFPNRLTPAGKRAIAIEFGFAVFNIPSRINAVVQPPHTFQIMLAVKAVAPSPQLFVIVLILHVQLIGDKRLVFLSVAYFPVGTRMMFAVHPIAVDLFDPGIQLGIQHPSLAQLDARVDIVAGAHTQIKIGFYTQTLG